MTDHATTEPLASPSDKASGQLSDQAGPMLSSEPEKKDGTIFAHTNQHVADRQAESETIERFTNTKQNIAEINDPKCAPRFTMTKREVGLEDKDDVEEPFAPSAKLAEQPMAEAQPSTDFVMPPVPAPMVGATNSHERSHAGTQDLHARTQDLANAAVDQSQTEEPAASADRALAKETRTSPKALPPAAIPPRKVPIDSAKTFIGENGTYYDENWRWMDWRGTSRSWNWPAALTFGHWFAYRRLYVFAGLHLLWLSGLAAASANNVPILILLMLAFLFVGLAGAYGNILYFQAFRRAVVHVTERGKGDYQELQSQLAAAGGTSTIALGAMAVLSLIGIVTAFVATYFTRGTILLNFWPFFQGPI